jgi:predicted nucleotidyltransferase
MSSDEEFLVRILQAAAAAGLEVIVVGSTAAVLQGAPVMTQDVDLLIRDTPRTREKLDRFCAELGGARQVRPSDLSESIKLLGLDVPVDILFDRLPTGQTFESLRARAERMPLGEHRATVACLEDVIASKEQADREKDRAQLPILRATLLVRQARSKKQ